jgi:hypothetical protein
LPLATVVKSNKIKAGLQALANKPKKYLLRGMVGVDKIIFFANPTISRTLFL